MAHKERVAALSNQVLEGHVLDVLREIPEGVVQCCVTSPPYWGFRTYGLPPVVWDGDPDCEHLWAAGRKDIDARIHDGAYFRRERAEPNRKRVESGMNLAGASFLRVDIPDDDSKAGFVTKFYGASAIYCIHVTDEAAARLAATACDRQAISSWSMDEYMERRRLKEGQPIDDVDEEEPTSQTR